MSTNLSLLVSLLMENLMQVCYNKIGRDRKTDTIGGRIRLRIHRGQCWDANQLPLQIDQSPATIARIYGGIGLDGFGDRRSC